MKQAVQGRELSGPARSGRFARDQVWDRILRVVKLAWKPLVLLLLFVPLCFVPAALSHPGPGAWFIMGLGVATAVWLEVAAYCS